ncbi:hypothetical protein JYU34_002409 [Plutella xylostella]|uniref:Transmembrane protein 231 n=1 Tax=Plutella xylostella TaxID=51655 RepID=A0ABQ7R259_PLUXY|nr:hypothetical protein JYU34_002409 [Plutella xylostella]
MALYKLFSCNLEVTYKSYFLSKAMIFTLFTTIINIILPFIIAYRGRGFWLKSESYFERPAAHFTYDYLLLLETDDPSQPILCSNEDSLQNHGEEYCTEFEVKETYCKDNSKTCMMDFKFIVNPPLDRTVTSVVLILGLDFQLKATCPLHMQSLAVVNKDFAVPPSGLKYYGDLLLQQVEHLPCIKYSVDTKYNRSLLNFNKGVTDNVIDNIMKSYFERTVTTQVKTFNSRATNGHTGAIDVEVHIRVPEMEILYIPSLLQELKWAWPQYLSLVVVFYWIINRIKRFVFNNRLLMAWEVMPWKK